MAASDPMSIEERRKYLKRMEPIYRKGGKQERGRLLNEMEGCHWDASKELDAATEAGDKSRAQTLEGLKNIPKVVGGITPACGELAAAYYGKAIDTVISVSSPDTAEMAKLLENSFRAVNIGLVNEILLMCDELGLDAWEVIDAAATKPFGSMKFTPGPGLGGHCIPIDPMYLSWKMREHKFTARFIELAGDINGSMPEYWVQRVQDKLNDVGKCLRGSRVLILGMACKKDVNDIRESPSLDIVHLMIAKGAIVSYHDPHVRTFEDDGMSLTSEPELVPALDGCDCAVIATDHSAYDWDIVRAHACAIVDTRHVLSELR